MGRQKEMKGKKINKERRARRHSGHSEIHWIVCSLLIECFSSMTTSSHLVRDEDLVWFSRPSHHHDNVWSTVRSLRYHYNESNTSLNSLSLQKNKRISVYAKSQPHITTTALINIRKSSSRGVILLSNMSSVWSVKKLAGLTLRWLAKAGLDFGIFNKRTLH